MTMPSRIQRPAVWKTTHRGSALVITLAFVTLISILLLGFLGGMRRETISAQSHRGGVVADIYADMGAQVAVAQLYSILGNPTNFYISSPGRILVYTPSPGVWTTNYLVSGIETNASAGILTDEAVDLNPPLAQGGGYLIAQTNATLATPQMYVKWIYQHQDGTYDAASPPRANPPVIGRFAYWVDDESSKINLNTAWNRNAANATNASSPSRVSLDVLSTETTAGQNPTNIYAYAFTNHLNSVEEIGRGGPGGVSVPNDTLLQKFSTTVYSHSPNISMTGVPRLLLTTQKWLADANGTTNFLDILPDNNESKGPYGSAGYVSPGLAASLNASKVALVLEKMSGELGATNWPFAPGKSFNGKYANPTDVEQIALNILDYVRSVESTNVEVEPIRIETYYPATPTNFGSLAQGTTAANQSPIGGTFEKWSTGRRIYITSMAVSFAPTVVHNTTGSNPSVPTGATYAAAPYFLKLYLPRFPGIKSIDLTQYRVGASVLTINKVAPTSLSTLTNSVNNTTIPITSGMVVSGSSTLQAGHTATIVVPAYMWLPGTGSPVTYPNWSSPTSLTVSLLAYITGPAASGNAPALREDIVNAQFMSITPGQTNTYCVDDPMVNKADSVTNSPSQWGMATNGPSGEAIMSQGLDSSTNSTLGKLSTTSPEQDADASGNVTANYMWVPAPNGDPSNLSGMVQSVGELGFVHTGNNSASVPLGTGVPWRTIHLQPQKSKTLLPDWAMLDLFAAPINTNVISAASLPYQLPYDTNNTLPVPSLGGCINLNAQIYGFDTNSNPEISTNRVWGLEALLNGALTNTMDTLASATNLYAPNGSAAVFSASRAGIVAGNILNGTPATGVAGEIGNNYTNFYHPAQLAEISGIADTGEASEAAIRETASLGAVSGNVFSIYAVGQSLKQDSLGGIHVVGEERRQVIVERIVTPGTPPKVQFQTISFRNL